MAIFNYRADNQQGKKRKGYLVAISEEEAVKTLNRQGLKVLFINEAGRSFEHRINQILNPIKRKEIVVFSRQLSIMIKSNISIIDSLLIIIEQINNLKFKNIISQVAYEIDNGLPLSEALKKHPRTFSDFYYNVIKAGETSGKLDEVLEYLADEIEKDYDLNKKLKGAMIYPLFVVSGLIIVGFVFLFFVLPEMTKILEETGATLPLSTRIIIAITNFLQNYFLYIVIFLIIFFILFRFFLKTSFGRNSFDTILLRIPISGKMLQLIYIVRFSRTLGVLLKGGVNTIKSLDIVRDIIKNTVYKNIISNTIDGISEGESIVASMENNHYIPKMSYQMMLIGEKTGKLEESLENIAGFYEKELNNKVANLNTILEPVIMVIMGIGVGVMVAGVIMPMYNIASQF